MDSLNIALLNYTPSRRCISLRDRSFILPACVNGEPSSETVTLDELKWLHAHSPVITDGTLEFDEDVRDEVYEALRITNWRATCLFERDMDDLLDNATLENVQRIINITSTTLIERVRGRAVFKQNTGTGNLSTKMVDTVNKRARELAGGIVRSNMAVQPNNQAQLTPDMAAIVQQEVARQLEAASAIAAAAYAEHTTPSKEAALQTSGQKTTKAVTKTAAKKAAAKPKVVSGE